MPLSRVTRLAGAQRIRDAELLDYDNQVEVTTDTGIQLLADFPSDGSATQDLVQTLNRKGAIVSFNGARLRVRIESAARG